MMTELSLIAVWTWGSASMLLWGFAAAIPLVLHLWNRRRFDQMPWAAMEFLFAAVRKNARRLRLEQLLLLLVRTALLLVFALALADPVLSWQSQEAIASTPSPTHYLFVLDTSYSMGYRPRDETRLAAAKLAIETVIENSRPGDGFSLLLMQDPPQPRVALATTDRRELTSQLSGIALSDGGADLEACLVAMEGQVESNRRRNPQLERAHVIFLTDLARTTWEAVTHGDCQQALDQLGEKAQLSLIDVGDELSPNIAVTRVGLDRKFVTLGETARIEAEVRSFGEVGPVRRRLELVVNDRVIDAQDLTIPANGSVTATKEYRFETPGDTAVEARLTSDSLKIDDRRWMVVPVHKTMDVLCIPGEPEAADYVALALNPNESADAPIQATVAPESALLDDTLPRFDCVVLSNVAQLGMNERAILTDYVRNGGGLIVALGDRVQMESYNRELGDVAAEERLLPARLERLSPIEEHFFDPLDYRHPVVAAFRGHERAGLLTVPTWRYVVLRPYTPTAEIALTFKNQHPAIVAETIGRGRVIVVATALSPSSTEQTAEGQIPWSALPTWPSFPPLVDGLVRNATAGRDAQRNLIVASTIPIESAQANASRATITTPEGELREVDLSNLDGVARGSFTDTVAAGLYTARLLTGEPSPLQQRFAVNLDSRESDLSRLPPSLLPESLQTRDDMDSGTPLVSTPRGVAMFRFLLAAAAMLLVIEGALAGWFGRRGA